MKEKTRNILGINFFVSISGIHTPLIINSVIYTCIYATLMISLILIVILDILFPVQFIHILRICNVSVYLFVL